MPIHFESFVEKEDIKEKLFAHIARRSCQDDFDFVTVSDDNKYIQQTIRIQNRVQEGNFIRHEIIGKTVYTLYVDNERETLEILDIDVVIHNHELGSIFFEELLPGSTDANEYYHVSDSREHCHFEVETVNRHVANKINDRLNNKESLEGKTARVSLSAYPFRIALFDDMDELNSFFNPDGKTVHVLGEDRIICYSEKFMSTHVVPKDLKNYKEHYSTFIGLIVDVEEVSLDFGSTDFPAKIVTVETGCGKMPTLVGPHFDCYNDLEKGKVVYMYADIKADLNWRWDRKEKKSLLDDID